MTQDRYGTLDRLAEQIQQDRQKRFNQMSQINYPTTNPLSSGGGYSGVTQTSSMPLRQYTPNTTTVYSLAEVQLTGGRMIGMTISAAPTIGKHLAESMKSTGFLHMFNESEALMIRSEEVVAIKLTKLTTE